MKCTAAALLIILLSCGSALGQSLSDSRLPDAVQNIIADYGQLVKSQTGTDFAKGWDNFVAMRKDRQIGLRVTDEPCSSLLEAISFLVNWDTKDAWIDFNKAAVRNYSQNKSIIYSVLTHELWHAYAYVHDPGFKDKDKDPFEDALYETDAYYVEGQFVDAVLVPQKMKISAFEKYLLDCYRGNALSSFTTTFRAEDLSVVNQLYSIQEDRLKGAIDQDSVYKRSIRIGKAVIDRYSEMDKSTISFTAYSHWIAVYTYNKFVQVLVNNTEKTRKNWGQIGADYPEFWKIVMEAGKIVNDRKIEMDKFMKQIQASLNVPAG